MPTIPLPTYEEIKADSDLADQQLSKMYGPLDSKAEIERKVEGLASVLRRYLVGRALTEDEQGTAKVILSYMSLEDLLRKAGQLNAAYSKKADEYAAKWNLLLFGNPSDERDFGLVGPPESTPVVTPPEPPRSRNHTIQLVL